MEHRQGQFSGDPRLGARAEVGVMAGPGILQGRADHSGVDGIEMDVLGRAAFFYYSSFRPRLSLSTSRVIFA